jgi:hypothetical protein
MQPFIGRETLSKTSDSNFTQSFLPFYGIEIKTDREL